MATIKKVAGIFGKIQFSCSISRPSQSGLRRQCVCVCVCVCMQRMRLLQAVNHRKQSIENYIDECIRPVYMASVHTSSTYKGEPYTYNPNSHDHYTDFFPVINGLSICVHSAWLIISRVFTSGLGVWVTPISRPFSVPFFCS